MSNTFVIRWKSRANGRAGRGSKLFGQEEAERLVRELNQEYPEIEHEAVDAESVSAPADSLEEAARSGAERPPPGVPVQ